MTYYSKLHYYLSLNVGTESVGRHKYTVQKTELQKYRIQTGYRFRSVVSLSFLRTGHDRHVAAPFGGTTLEGVTAMVTGYSYVRAAAEHLDNIIRLTIQIIRQCEWNSDDMHRNVLGRQITIVYRTSATYYFFVGKKI